MSQSFLPSALIPALEKHFCLAERAGRASGQSTVNWKYGYITDLANSFADSFNEYYRTTGTTSTTEGENGNSSSRFKRTHTTGPIKLEFQSLFPWIYTYSYRSRGLWKSTFPLPLRPLAAVQKKRENILFPFPAIEMAMLRDGPEVCRKKWKLECGGIFTSLNSSQVLMGLRDCMGLMFSPLPLKLNEDVLANFFRGDLKIQQHIE